MKNDLGFLKLIKVVLLIGVVIALAVTAYQMRGGFIKGWQDGAKTTANAYHIPVFENIIIPASDSLNIKGNKGFDYKLKTKLLVSGDVFDKTMPHKMLSFLSGFKNVLAIAMLLFSILLLLKLYYFIDDSSKGLIFTLENINRIKVIGIYCISLSVISFLWDVIEYYIMKELFSHTTFKTEYVFDFNYLLLTVGIVTIVIMEVFKKGYGLKQEQELTV